MDRVLHIPLIDPMPSLDLRSKHGSRAAASMTNGFATTWMDAHLIDVRNSESIPKL